jgi:RND family efflux transporter MFP subunit
MNDYVPMSSTFMLSSCSISSRFFVVVGLLGLFLAGCQRAGEVPAGTAQDRPRPVRVAAVEAVDGLVLGLSATLRARVEAPLAFQVGGRITARRVDTRQRVRAGAVLFELDPADLAEAVRAAEAERKAADSAFATAQADFQRLRDLQARGFVSEQALDRARLSLREAESQRDAAQARWAQAQNARAYAHLVSPAQGVVVEVRAEPGQVVAAGQTVAVLARDGPREVELFFPDGVVPPQSAE